uniref:Protein kinase domain-containing protein n=1 Tax=Arcella intermedia TaxID=1963864 RepID=A0A6B2L8U8_9EUKA
MEERATRAPSRVPVLKGEGQIRSKELELINSDNPTEIFEEQAVEAKGGFGKVVRAVHTVTNAVVAVKKVKHQNLKQQRDNLQEIMFMEEAKELPNIVKYYTSYEHPPHLWIVMEYVEGAPLSLFFSEKNGTLLQRLTEDMLAYLAQQILIGLEALHHHQIAHRDIKPSNIILSIHGHVKLIDFGLCVDVSGGPDYHMVGSSYWMAPEVIRGALHSTPVDIWGFGICMAELINGVAYSSMTNSVRMMFDVAIKGMPVIKQADWSDAAKEFVESCLQMDPQARPTATQLLEHEFMEAILEDSPEYLGDWVHWAFYESDDDEEMVVSNGSLPKIKQIDEEISEDD